ncbi:DUF1758 domain-containing protein [Trichonephila clavipes]|uniref:DUF1758 domain-containing protein n=1 Tax=Trichonephila clavipes TaxID=2585209 RepID=A0A8X7BHG2_TRICX|nr:DUF1758 domain-containing protein [Trichonephila clavipes]
MAVEIRLGQSSSSALATKWKTFQKEFEQVCSIHIPRWIHTTSKQITLHGFVMRLSWLCIGHLCCSRKPMEYDVHFYAWTDSQVVLSWLSSHPGTGNLTLPIEHPGNLDLVPADSWRYVPTKMNPADIACRGLSPKELPHVFYGGRPSMAFPVRWTLGLSNPREMIRLVQCQRKENEQLLAFPVAVSCDFIDYLFLKIFIIY